MFQLYVRLGSSLNYFVFLHWLALSFSAQSWERKHSEKSIETAKLAAELRTASQRHAELQVF